MTNLKLCFIRQRYCDTTQCQIWDTDNQCCSITLISKNIGTLTTILSTAINELMGGNLKTSSSINEDEDEKVKSNSAYCTGCIHLYNVSNNSQKIHAVCKKYCDKFSYYTNTECLRLQICILDQGKEEKDE